MMSFLFLLIAPWLVPTVSIEAYARPAHSVVRAIVAETGARLEVDAPLRDEILVVRVEDAPLEETLGKIAEVVHGEWRLKDGVKHLFRSPELQRALQDSEVKERAEAVRRSFEPLLRVSVARQFDAAQADLYVRAGVLRNQALSERRDLAEFHNFEDMSPMTRALRRLLTMVDPVEFAKLGRGERAVYTFNPNSMQRRLPPGAKHVVESLVLENRLLEEAGARYRTKNPNQRVPTPGESGVTSASGLRPLLAVQCRGADYFDLSLRFADGVGRMLGVAMTIHTISGTLEHAPKLLTEVAAERRPWVPVAGGPWRPGSVADPAQTRAALASPESVDPLDWFARALLKPWAETRGKQLVACLPDRTALVATLPAGSTLGMVGASIQRNPDLIVSEDNGWLSVGPAHPATTSRERSDRKVVGEFLRTVLDEGRTRLNVESRLAMGAPYCWDTLRPDHLASRLGVPLRQTSVERAQGYVERPFLQMLHTLTDGQLEGMLDGGLRLDRLSATQRQYVSAAFYSLEGEANPYGVDPTELAPNGLDNRVLLGLQLAEDTVASASTRGSDKETAALDSTKLASNLFVGFSKIAAPVLTDLDYHVGKRVRYSFLLVTAPGYTRTIQFEDSPELSGRWTPFDQLPSSFRESLSEQYERLRVLGARGTPPPKPWSDDSEEDGQSVFFTRMRALQLRGSPTK